MERSSTPREPTGSYSAAGADRRHRALAALATTALAALLVLVSAAPASAQDDGVPVQELAERYAPIVMVKAQAAPCDTEGESFEPAPVDIVLDNPEVFLRQVGNGDPVAMRGPGAADLFDLQEGWYLDFPADALDPQCIFETDYGRFSADLPSVVYAHVATEDGRPDMLGLQYWFFYYHNRSKNDHEGDWEFIQLLFDVGTVEQALRTEPIAVGLAQHEGGERSDWDDEKLQKEGTRPVVYPAKGSHATYYGQALFLGRSGAEGFGCDNTDSPSRRVDPDVVVLPDEVTDPADPLAWLGFKGRWGQRERAFFNGPTGPAEKARWNEPVTWHEDLRDSSVVIPAGDRAPGSVLNSFCTIVEAGSTALVQAIRSPLVALLGLGAIVYLAVAFARRTTWSPVATTPLRVRRRAGQIVGAAIRFSAQRWRTTLLIGLIFVPLSIATSLLQAIVQSIPLIGDLVSLAGDRSGTGVILAIAVGGVGNALAFTVVTAAVAATIDRPHPARSGVAESAAPLLSAFFRAAVIVLALLVSVVGIPWGIRQLVRYQMIPQVVILEGLAGREALARSTELVRGRWWWTAAITAALQSLIGAAGLVFALLVLIIFTGIPLWAFNLFSSLVFVLIVPITAAAMVYVYGELAARPQRSPDAGEVETEVDRELRRTG